MSPADTGDRTRPTVRQLTADERHEFAAARLRAVALMPYFATALLEAIPVAAPGLGTFAVDRHWRLYLDPATLRAWGPTDAAGVLIHEVNHLLRDHAGRHDDRADGHHRRWNIAADAEINDDLLAADVPLPGTPVTPELLDQPDGQLAETYFDRLRPQARRIEIISCGSGSGGAALDVEGVELEVAVPVRSQTEQELTRRKVASDIAAARATARHDVPKGIERWAQRVLAPPKVDWRQLLRSAVRRGVGIHAGRLDYSYRKPGRRQLPRIVTPSMHQPAPRVVSLIDTSASMSRSDLDSALAEVEGICTRAGIRGRGHRVMSADTHTRSLRAVRTAADVRLHGGGGTDLRGPMAEAAKLKPRPHVLIVFTDGLTPWPERPPAGAHTIIVLIGGTSRGATLPPWARVIDCTP